MFCLPFRWKGLKGDPRKASDPEIFHEPRAPRDSLGAAAPRQPAGMDPGEFSVLCQHRRPGKGWDLSRAEQWNQDGIQPCRGARKSWRDTGVPGEAGDVHGCAPADGKEPGACWNGRVQQEKVKVENTPSGVQHLGKDVRDELCESRNGNVPRCARVDGKAPELPEKLGNARGGKTQQEEVKVENTPSGVQHLGKDIRDKPCESWNGNVLREGTDPPQSPLQAGSSEDEEGESSGSSQSLESCMEGDTDAATAPGGSGDGHDLDSPSAAGTPGVEPRSWLQERLSQLGEDTESWEDKSTAALSAKLVQLILQTPTRSYPTEPGIGSVRQEQRSGASQDLALSIPVPVCGSVTRNAACFLGMLRPFGNTESGERWEEETEEEVVPRALICWPQVSAALAEEFPEVWASSRLDCGRVAEEVRLDGAPVPPQAQPPQPPHVEEQMAELLREYWQEGIVVEGRSAFNHPLILIPKSNGSGWRLTLDCRALNKATPVGPPARPSRAGILASIKPRSRFFSVLDLSNASLAIPLARDSWARFAFTFRGQQFLFTRLPPTFRGTSSILHWRVAAMLAQLEPGAARGVFHYYDDILVIGKTWRQAEYRTRRVLQLIQRTGFKARREKSQLVKPEVKYLGMIIGAEGWRIPEEKVREIGEACDAPGPWNATRLRSVLGKFNSCRDFIPDYCELALPLQRLAGQGNRDLEWERERELEQQLQRLREALEAAPVLRFPNKSRPFLIRLSLHAETAGATLLQEKVGILHLVGHKSRKLSDHTYTPLQRRCLAAVWAVQAFQSLTGPAPIVIRDPAGNYLIRGEALRSNGPWLPEECPVLPEPWTLLLTSKGPEQQKSQWIVIPEAPPFQQLPFDIPEANVWFLAVEKRSSWKPCVGFAAASLEERWVLGVSQEHSEMAAGLEALRELLVQHRSPSPLLLYSTCPALVARLERLEEEQGWNSDGNALPGILCWLRAFPGMLYVRKVESDGSQGLERDWIRKVRGKAAIAAGRAGRGWKLWEPSKYERQEIVARCHRWHEDVDDTLSRVWRVQSWEGDCREVARWVQNCPKCRMIDPDPDPDPAPQRVEGPWSCLSISLSKNLPRSPEGFRLLLVVQDTLSGWVDAFPLRGRSEPEVTQTLLREVFENFGKVRSVRLGPAPSWIWKSRYQSPLRDFWSLLERSEPPAAAACLWRVAQAAGRDWPAALPLILAGIRSGCVEPAQLGPLLCVPGLPLEQRWECSGAGAEPAAGNEPEKELARLRGMRVLAGLRQRLEAALR